MTIIKIDRNGKETDYGNGYKDPYEVIPKKYKFNGLFYESSDSKTIYIVKKQYTSRPGGYEGRKENNMSYSINQVYVVLNENMDVVEWFDTLEDAEKYVENLESQENE